jgi:hypothetical protein
VSVHVLLQDASPATGAQQCTGFVSILHQKLLVKTEGTQPQGIGDANVGSFLLVILYLLPLLLLYFFLSFTDSKKLQT